jgi:hypothetical protein
LRTLERRENEQSELSKPGKKGRPTDPKMHSCRQKNEAWFVE